MKIYEILDSETKLSIGVLQYYEKEHSCVIELQEYLDEWTAPLLFTSYVKRGIYTMPRDISFLWVKERVIPSGRQNINEILSNHRMARYDEMKMLEIASGRCSQDNLYIEEMNQLPEYVKERKKHNLTDCVISEKNTVLCFFADDTVKKIALEQFKEIDGVDKVIKNSSLFESGEIGTDGYCLTFNHSIDVPASELYNAENKIPFNKNDFDNFVRKNILDTTETCDILECTRQNIAYMVKKQMLSPVKMEAKGNLYLKGDILRNKW